jgi:hypothetical protein
MTSLEISKILVENKYRLDTKFCSAVFVVDIPKTTTILSSHLHKEEQIIQKVKELLLFIEENGAPVDGFRFRDIALELKQLTKQ